MTESEPRLVSARGMARGRRPRLGRFLLGIAAVLALGAIVAAFNVSWTKLESTRAEMRRRMETEIPHRFLAPGTGIFEFPAGRVFISYLTDTEFDGTRHLAPNELVFELTILDAAGDPIDVEVEATHRANLQSSRPGRSAAAVLVGSAVLPDAGRYTFDLQLGENESSQAVADVFVIDANEVAVLESAFGPVLGTVCSGGAAALFGVLGGLTIWMERRTATALAAIEG
ncbi:MAG: hypothetical protein P8J88_11990 [Phycisphaerales bacterium]|nr:hypothetical protein [Phycisphaerales bacterium]MDG2134193.1 hypothetical protein [Phycisphaerales bacterium]